MQRILVIEASPRDGLSKKYANQFCEKIKASSDAEIDIISLKNFDIHSCHGCCACFSLGEEKCPEWADATAGILDKMLRATGIVVFTPDYALQVPALLKNLFDRLSFVFHRPRLFGKVSMSVVTQGVFGGKKIIKYMDELMGFWGCKTVRGMVLNGALKSNEDFPQNIKTKCEQQMDQAVQRLLKALNNPKPSKPSLFRSAIFRMTRSSMRYFPAATPPDRAYYEKMGWLTSNYYYDVKIGLLNTLLGVLLDKMIKNMAKKEAKTKSK